MTTAVVEAPPAIRITLPKVEEALRKVGELFADRRNVVNQLVGIRDETVPFYPVSEMPEEFLEPGCMIGVLLHTQFDVPLHAMAGRANNYTIGTRFIDGVVFEDPALQLLSLAQRLADEVHGFGVKRTWGEVAARVAPLMDAFIGGFLGAIVGILILGIISLEWGDEDE